MTNILFRGFYIFLIDALIVVAFTSRVSAAYTVYGCSTLPVNGGVPSPICTSDVFTWEGGDGYVANDNTIFYQDDTEYFFVAETTGSGTLRVYLTETIENHYDITTHDIETQFNITTPSNGNDSIVFLQSESGTPYSGTVDFLCVSDTSFDECTDLPPPTPTTTPTTTQMTIDNPAQNAFNGFLLAILTMFFVIWMFKRP